MPLTKAQRPWEDLDLHGKTEFPFSWLDTEARREIQRIWWEHYNDPTEEEMRTGIPEWRPDEIRKVVRLYTPYDAMLVNEVA